MKDKQSEVPSRTNKAWEKYCSGVYLPIAVSIEVVRRKANLPPNTGLQKMAAMIDNLSEQLRMTEVRGKGHNQIMEQVDWLAFAIGRLGGPKRAARKLDTTPTTVYNWLSGGLANVKFGEMVKLAKAANVPLEFLGQRLHAVDDPNGDDDDGDE